MKLQTSNGKCYVIPEGERRPDYMNISYDRLPIHVRERLASSPFNICPACTAMSGDPMAFIRRAEQEVRSSDGALTDNVTT